MGDSVNAAVQLLGTALASTVLVAIINAIVTRRKTGAETETLSAGATKIITDAAAIVVQEIRADNERLRIEAAVTEERLDDLEHERAEWQREREEWRRVLQVHAAWDSLAITAIRDAIPPIELPQAPPLTPPTLPRRRPRKK